MTLAGGATFAGYRIEEIAGPGGMGTVYRARQVALDRAIALEVIDPELRECVEHESRVLGAIEHPSLLGIYEAGEADGRLFVARRWVEGTDLGTLLADGLERQRAARILDQVAEALAVAHDHGLVHGAVAAENILVEGDDHAYLTNFAGGPGPPAADRQALHELRDAALASATAPVEPAPVGPRSRRPLAIAAAALGLLVLAGAAVVLASGGDDSEPKRTARTGGKPEPLPGGRPKVEHFSLGPRVAPGEIAIDDGGVYVDDRTSSRLLFVDSESGTVSRRLRLRGSYAIVPDGYRPRRLWVSYPLLHRVGQVDTKRGRVVGRPFRVPGTPALLGVGRDELVVSGDPAKAITLRRLDKETGRQLGQPAIEKHSSATDLDLAAGQVNVTHWIAAAILTYDEQLRHGRFIDFHIPDVNTLLGPMGTETAIGRDDVAWVLVNYASPKRIVVVRANLRTRKQIGKMIELGKGSARDIAVDQGVVWVPNVGEGTVTRIDERTGRIIGTPLAVGEIEGDVAARDGRAWITGARDLVRITP